MKRNILSENMRRFGTKNLNEQSEPRDPKSKIMPKPGEPGYTKEFKKGIQCFLNKINQPDQAGDKLAVDGSIGNYPDSKTAQAIWLLQDRLNKEKGLWPVDGVFGQDTYDALSPAEKDLFHACIEEMQSSSWSDWWPF